MHGDVVAVAWFGVDDVPVYHRKHLCASASRGGQLEALQWLRAYGCDWDANTCSRAARGGHLAVLQWLRANGCEWNADTLWAAEEKCHHDVADWACANGCPKYEEDY